MFRNILLVAIYLSLSVSAFANVFHDQFDDNYSNFGSDGGSSFFWIVLIGLALYFFDKNN